VAAAGIAASAVAMNSAPSQARTWPEVMFYVSITSATVLMPLRLWGLFCVLVSLP